MTGIPLSRSLALGSSGVFFVLAVIIATAFWWEAIRHVDRLPSEHVGKITIVLALFFVIQLLSLLFLGRLVSRAWRSPSAKLAWLALPIGVALAVANGLSYLFTPVLGGPLALVVLLVAFGVAKSYQQENQRRE